MNTLTPKYPRVTAVNLAHGVTIHGNTFKKGMLIVHGSCGDLPDWSEIIQLCIVKDDLSLVIRTLSSWSREHCELHPTRELALVNVKEFADQYPLADYKVGSMQTLKRFVHVTGNLLNFNNVLQY